MKTRLAPSPEAFCFDRHTRSTPGFRKHTRAPARVGRLLARVVAISAFGLWVPLKAATLNVVPVSAPAINCLFNTNCTITSEKERAEIFHWFYDTGDGRLQSQVWHGMPGSPAAGLYAYVYRLDLGAMTSQGGAGCVARFSVPAPAGVVPMDFNADGQANDHVFVITQGGLGSVQPLGASADSGRVWFDFGDTHVSTGVCPGQSTFFFGFVSSKPPALANANLEFVWIEPTLKVPAYAPGALTFGFPTQPIGSMEFIGVSNLLALSSFPSGGGGFEVALGESQGWRNVFSDVQVGAAGDYSITMVGEGKMGPRNEAFIGTARLWVTNGLLFTSADFPGAGVSNLVIEYRGPTGKLIAQIVRPPGWTSCGLPLCTNYGPMDIIPTVCSNAFVSLNGEPAACWMFCKDICAIDTSCALVALHEPIRTICVLGKSPSAGPVQAITNLNLLLAGIDSVSSTSQMLRWSNAWHQAKGEAVLTATPGGVQVSKPNSADDGGLIVGSFPGNVADLLIPRLPPNWWTNLPMPSLGLSVLGAGSAGQSQLAALSFGPGRAGLQFTADFSPIGSAAYDAAVFVNDNEIGRYAAVGPITVDEVPARISFAKPAFTPFVSPSPIILLNWETPVTFHAEGRPDLMGDTVMLLPLNPTSQVLQADRITLLFHGMTSVATGGYHALPAIQHPLEGIQFGDGSVRWRSDTLPGATYFLEMTPELGPSASWQSLESFVGNGFSRAFSLPAARSHGFVRLRVQ